ncbi:MAG: hypothetical protein ACP5PJ_00610 [Acidimicrobiales bacterium]
MNIDGSGNYSIEPSEQSFEFKASGITVATVTKNDEVLGFRLPTALASEQFAITSSENRGRVVSLLDRDLSPIARIAFERQRARRAPLRCTIAFHDDTVLELRMDGPTGLHLIDASGKVRGLGSFRGAQLAQGIDILLVHPDPRWVPMTIFAIFLLMALRLNSLEGKEQPWSEHAQPAPERPS